MYHYMFAALAVGLSTIPQTIWALSQILPVRKSVHRITALAIFKLGVYSFLVDYLLREYYGDTFWWHLLWLILGTSIPVAMYIVFIDVFDGQVVKRLLIPIIVETVIELPAVLGLSFANMIVTGKFQANLMTDLKGYILLIPLSGYGLFALLWKGYGTRILAWCQREFAHVRILWAVVLFYLLASILSYWGDVMAAEEGFLLVGMIPNILLLIWLSVLMFREGNVSEREIAHRNKMTVIRRVLEEEHDRRLKEQEDKIEKHRAYIEKHLEQTVVQGAAAREYYEELVRVYQEIDAGVYAKNRLLDAVLSRESRACKEQGIQTEIVTSSLVLTRHKEEVLLEILLLLFEEARFCITGCPTAKIELSVTPSAGRHIIDFQYGPVKKVSKRTAGKARKRIRRLVEGEQGEILLKQEDEQIKVELFI